GLQRGGECPQAGPLGAARRSKPHGHPRPWAGGGPTAMNPDRQDGDRLPPGLAGRLDPVCDRFESEWLAGSRPRLEDFLPQVAEPDRPALLRELLETELHHRARLGERPTAEEDPLRLPEHASRIARVFAP